MAKPSLVQYASYAPAVCCQYQPPTKKKGKAPPKVPGIMVFLQVSYRGNPGAPLKKVWGSDAKDFLRFVTDLKASEQAASEQGSVTFQFELCLPCDAFKRDQTGYTVDFELHAKDAKGKTSRDVMGIYMGADHFEGLKCCPPVPVPPVRPVRRH